MSFIDRDRIDTYKSLLTWVGVCYGLISLTLDSFCVYLLYISGFLLFLLSFLLCLLASFFFWMDATILLSAIVGVETGL